MAIEQPKLAMTLVQLYDNKCKLHKGMSKVPYATLPKKDKGRPSLSNKTAGTLE